MDVDKNDAHNNNQLQIKTIETKKGYDYIKRTLDIVGSISGLLLLCPLFLIIVLFMKKEDFAAPIIFSQTRIGKDEKKFKMYKFRSMVIDAEEQLTELLEHNEVEGAMFKIKKDPRVTNVGKFIRRTSIDELPQLWNVLKGEMSLVGPRPPLEREVVQYTYRDKQRLQVKPGCTGLWQVSGRNDLGFSEMVDLDLKYISERHIFTDILIIVKTINHLLFYKTGN